MDANTLGICYLLHFDRPYKHAQHYLGWTNDLQKRLREHRSGNRTKCVLTSVVTFEGIGWRVARLWHNVPLSFEKELKRGKNNRKLCPHCNVNVHYDPKLSKYNKHNPDRLIRCNDQ